MIRAPSATDSVFVKPRARGRLRAYRGGMDAERDSDDVSEENPGGEPVGDDAPLGGDETTEDQLEADNPAEEEMLKTLDPDAAPA